MNIIIGSSFWIFILAVILNSIELSLQSGIFGLQVQGPKEPEISIPRISSPKTPSFRKVRCPTGKQVHFETTFLIKDDDGFYVKCTEDKILLAVGPLIIGHISNNVIHPISGTSGSEIVYNESTNKQTVVGKGYLKRNYNVFSTVPAETLSLSEIQPFGMFSPKEKPRSPTRLRSPGRHNSPKRNIIRISPVSPTKPSSPPPVRSGLESGPGSSFDSNANSSKKSSRVFSDSSSLPIGPPSSSPSSAGKE